MRDDMNDLVHKLMIRGDFGVPRLNELIDDNRNERVELQINLVRTRQRRQQLLQRFGRAPVRIRSAGCSRLALLWT